MKLPALLLAALCGACSSAPAGAPTLRQDPIAHETGAIVGTFDSRALTIAYVRSRPFLEYQLGIQTDLNRVLQRAHAFGDDALERDVQALGPAMQERIHASGFGTARADEALERLRARLPAIAEEAGVDLIVGTWDVVHRRDGARTVDLTERLAAEFEPDEATWQAIREVVAAPPDPKAGR